MRSPCRLVRLQQTVLAERLLQEGQRLEPGIPVGSSGTAALPPDMIGPLLSCVVGTKGKEMPCPASSYTRCSWWNGAPCSSSRATIICPTPAEGHIWSSAPEIRSTGHCIRSTGMAALAADALPRQAAAQDERSAAGLAFFAVPNPLTRGVADPRGRQAETGS